MPLVTLQTCPVSPDASREGLSKSMAMTSQQDTQEASFAYSTSVPGILRLQVGAGNQSLVRRLSCAQLFLPYTLFCYLGDCLSTLRQQNLIQNTGIQQCCSSGEASSGLVHWMATICLRRNLMVFMLNTLTVRLCRISTQTPDPQPVSNTPCYNTNPYRLLFFVLQATGSLPAAHPATIWSFAC